MLSYITAESAIYFIFIAACSVVIFLLMRRLLRQWEQQRQKRVSNKDNLQVAVSTSSPLKNPLKRARETAVRSIESRFSIIRRLGVLLLILTGALALLFPFLGTIPQTVISLLAASSGVFIGIAAKPFIENFIAGIVLTFARPFRTGDTVSVDQDYYGTIEDITMTYTILKTWDWQRYVIPNSKMMTKDFVNLTLKDSYQWCYVEFWVAPDTDLEIVKAKSIIAAEGSAHFADYEPPNFWIMELGREGIRCWVAAWADSPADAWQLSSDIRTELALHFRTLKISPHRWSLDIHNQL